MADEFWEIAKQFSSNQKPLKKGYLLKSEFCKKYSITLKEFEKLLKNENVSDSKYIHKRSGSWQKGVFQYQEKYFAELLKSNNLKQI